ncbi:MAG: MiaB/RimO family radical SAM methylthiotransferase [Rickettsiales bacterium]|nr:MiaB/RimO family radical SAM methylthiotransferase [Rickettsiales bacterium]
MKKLHIKTYGCQMNVYDSDRMQDLMNAIGYENSDTPENSDMVIINTCHIREKAAEKLFSDLGRIRPHKEKMQQQGKQMIVAVSGCVAQAEGEEIFRRSNVVDIIVGPESYQTLPDLVGKVIRDKKKQINLEFSPNDKFDILRELSDLDLGSGSPLFKGDRVDALAPRSGLHNDSPLFKGDRVDALAPRSGLHKNKSASAFVTVQEGCDKFCTFCVVPYTRGAEYSRPSYKIYEEALKLANQGVKEIYFLGQNVNAYHGLNEKGEIISLAKLIAEVAKIPQIERIRYTTSHPRDMDDELILAHGEIEKLMPFLHLPIQSGSNAILKAMNRKHTRKDYFKIIEKLRKQRPDIGLSSDFIVGFPGETDKDFEDTLDLVKQIGFTQCYSFKYSPRPGTPSADAKIQVEEKVKDERLAILQKLLSEQQIEFNKNSEDKIMPVLFEKEAPKSAKDKSSSKLQLWGKSPYLQSVIIEVENKNEAQKFLGKIAPVKILKSRPSSLIGELLN